MAYLAPDRIRREQGLAIKEKIIPWGARWTKNSGSFKKGDLFKADRKLSGGSGKVEWVTIHNTAAISVNPATTMAEQYTRATWPNQNMKDVRVHYYIDGIDCWQNLREDEVGWHAGTEGNKSSLAIEIIGSSQEAEDRGALLAAILLCRHGLGIDRLTTHHRWYRPKYCPLYILPHWDAFAAKVKQHLQAFSGQGQKPQEPESPGRLYRVQVGAYSIKANADKMRDAVKAKGFPAFVARGDDGLYRVQVGAYSVKANAQAMLEKVKAAGFPAILVS